MQALIKSVFPLSKFETLPPIIIKSVNDYVIPYNPPKNDIIIKKPIALHPPTPVKKERPPPRQTYDFIDEDGPVPEAAPSKNMPPIPVPEAAPIKILKRPTNETPRDKKPDAGPLDEEPKCALQLILATIEPELIMMNKSQWGTYIHTYVTEEYVRIGTDKTIPMRRMRKQLIADMEEMEKLKGEKMLEKPLVMNYLAWRYQLQFLVHLVDREQKKLMAYPEMHLWRRDVPIYCLGTSSMSPLKFSQVREYIEHAEDSGVHVVWPNPDGKKTELLAELGGAGAHLKKDELSQLVGKKRVYDLFGH
jgi:hypothetical protein